MLGMPECNTQYMDYQNLITNKTCNTGKDI